MEAAHPGKYRAALADFAPCRRSLTSRTEFRLRRNIAVSDVATADQAARTPPGRHTLKLLVIPIIGLIIASNVANAMWPTLQENHPLLLIALSSINRYLILVSEQLDPVSYYVVGTARLLVSDPLFFLLGYWYGDNALAWVEKRSTTYGPLLRKGQAWFGKAAWPLVVIAPNNIVCLFAGAAGMRVVTFYALNITGTLGRLYLIRVLGETFDSPIGSFRDFVSDYQIPLIIVSVILVAFSMRREFSRGGEIDDLRHIDERLIDDEPSADGRSGAGPSSGSRPRQGSGEHQSNE